MLGLPVRGLRDAAERHGYLIRVGQAIRLDVADLGELLDKCRSRPREPACSSDAAPDAPPSGSSRTRVSPSVRQAQQIAERLKSRSPTTSPRATGDVVPLARTK